MKWPPNAKAAMIVVAVKHRMARAMDVILHLGAHRCATTSFQAYLDANRDPLRSAGVAAWTPAKTRGGLFDGLMGPPDSHRVDMHRAVGRVRLQQELLLKSGLRELIVSEENMIGAPRNNLRAARLYPDASLRMQRWASVFAGRVRHIGLTIRSYDTYWASAMSFALVQGHRPLTEAECDYLVTQPRRWRDVITDVAAAFPKARITVWRFEDYAVAPHRQLCVLTSNAPHRRIMKKSAAPLNVSPNRTALRAALGARGQNAHWIPAGMGPWMPFNVAQQDTLQAQYADDALWLEKGAGGIAQFVVPMPMQLPETYTKIFGAISCAINAPPSLFGGYNGTENIMV